MMELFPLSSFIIWKGSLSFYVIKLKELAYEK